MAKDDYFFLVCKLLKYLYKCLKNNLRADWSIVAPNSKDFPISEEYFTYILSHLLADGYIEGFVEVRQIGGGVQFKETSGLKITPKGIEYLEENSKMKKVIEIAGSAIEIATNIIPAIK